MLILRREHEEAFHAASFRRYKRSLSAFLRTEHAKDVARYDDGALRALIDASCLQSQGYGLVTARQMRCFVQCVVLTDDRLGPDSRRTDLVKVLRDTKIPADDRVSTALKLASLQKGQGHSAGRRTTDG